MGIETMLLEPGPMRITPGAADACRQAQQSASEFLELHFSGFWGELDEEDWQANQSALASGERLLSAYTLGTGQKLWIITEADRSATTILLPEEY